MELRRNLFWKLSFPYLSRFERGTAEAWAGHWYMRGVIKKACWICVDHQVSIKMVILGGAKVISIIFEHIQHASCWMKIRPWLFPSAGTFTSDTNPVAQWRKSMVSWWNPSCLMVKSAYFGDFSLNQSFDYHDLWVEITSNSWVSESHTSIFVQKTYYLAGYPSFISVLSTFFDAFDARPEPLMWRHPVGLDNLIEAFTVIALQDAVHPTPLFELLGIALEEIPITKEVRKRKNWMAQLGEMGDMETVWNSVFFF